jgi:hypothetical protein
MHAQTVEWSKDFMPAYCRDVCVDGRPKNLWLGLAKTLACITASQMNQLTLCRFTLPYHHAKRAKHWLEP